MKKERVMMLDGKRYLIFYTFDDVESVDEKSEIDTTTDDVREITEI